MGIRLNSTLMIALMCLTAPMLGAQPANAQAVLAGEAEGADGPAMDYIEIETYEDAEVALNHYVPYRLELMKKIEAAKKLSASSKLVADRLIGYEQELKGVDSEIALMKKIMTEKKPQTSVKAGVAVASGAKPKGVTTENPAARAKPSFELDASIYENAKREAYQTSRRSRTSAN